MVRKDVGGSGGKTSSNVFKAVLAIVVVQIGFGCYGVTLKKFNNDHPFNPVVFSFYRDIGCFVVLFCAARIFEGPIRIPTLREVPLFVALGLSGCWANQLFYLMGAFFTTADIASIWQPAIVVWTALLSILFRVEAPPPLKKLHGALKALGMGFAIAGAIVMTLGKQTVSCAGLDHAICTNEAHKHACAWNSAKATCGAASSKNGFLGNMFLLINTMSTAIYVIVQKQFVFAKPSERGSSRLSKALAAHSWSGTPLFVTSWSYLFGAIFMVLTALVGYLGKVDVFEFTGSTNTFKIPVQVLIPLTYSVFISSALCYGLITYANMHLDPSVVTAFWPLQVPVAVLLSLAVGLGGINATQGLGGGLVILGTIFVSLAERQRQAYLASLGDHQAPEELAESLLDSEPA